MKFTVSEDGRKRTTITIKLRLTPEEVSIAKRRAENTGSNDWKYMLESMAALTIENELQEYIYGGKS